MSITLLFSSGFLGFLFIAQGYEGGWAPRKPLRELGVWKDIEIGESHLRRLEASHGPARTRREGGAATGCHSQFGA